MQSPAIDPSAPAVPALALVMVPFLRGGLFLKQLAWFGSCEILRAATWLAMCVPWELV